MLVFVSVHAPTKWLCSWFFPAIFRIALAIASQLRERLAVTGTQECDRRPDARSLSLSLDDGDSSLGGSFVSVTSSSSDTPFCLVEGEGEGEGEERAAGATAAWEEGAVEGEERFRCAAVKLVKFLMPRLVGTTEQRGRDLY